MSWDHQAQGTELIHSIGQQVAAEGHQKALTFAHVLEFVTELSVIGGGGAGLTRA